MYRVPRVFHVIDADVIDMLPPADVFMRLAQGVHGVSKRGLIRAFAGQFRHFVEEVMHIPGIRWVIPILAATVYGLYLFGGIRKDRALTWVCCCLFCGQHHAVLRRIHDAGKGRKRFMQGSGDQVLGFASLFPVCEGLGFRFLVIAGFRQCGRIAYEAGAAEGRVFLRAVPKGLIVCVEITLR